MAHSKIVADKELHDKARTLAGEIHAFRKTHFKVEPGAVRYSDGGGISVERLSGSRGDDIDQLFADAEDALRIMFPSLRERLFSGTTNTRCKMQEMMKLAPELLKILFPRSFDPAFR